MLQCRDLTVRIGRKKQTILDEASADFQPGTMNAIIGPSGCGKTTLVKAMLGILPSTGRVYYDGRKIASPKELVGQVGFTPQFTIAHKPLTVREVLAYALKLNVRSAQLRRERLEWVLQTIGLNEHQEKKVGSLSGGQLRRLGLGLELTNNPACMVCDEVTSGLDPTSEDHILGLLRNLVQEQNKTFLCIIHNLAKLDQFDCVTVVHHGHVIFQGHLSALLEYFGIVDALQLYGLLHSQPLEHWTGLWAEYGGVQDLGEGDHSNVSRIERPMLLAQFMTLSFRRLRLFFRDFGQIFLTMAITFGFPCLVVIFALDGLPQLQGTALQPTGNLLETMQDTGRYRMEAAKTASLVTSLIMFQVILLTLMGSNTGAREIASERDLYEKERLNGLRPTAYALSKIFFTTLIAAGQGIWMMFFVKQICGFPGSFLPQGIALAMTCLAMTAVCLGISSMVGSSEKASLLSVYLVGFQLPLSGVVLALPEQLVWLTRPFISAYWGWAGYLQSIKETRFWDAFREMDEGFVASPELAAGVLAIHIMVGFVLVFLGCQRRGWR
ncbi:MAG: ABC transporter ATP-binding protein/permease [Opitutae bacterium]|nr:ABC transporter ATP-binding protein/permease [Opitutae bacterium]MBT5380817.1 ABC transporter ATP-binding protein/permease [Opitutae bacterium]MBT5690870.1 ABC transporter ATP-binding protein/permease [Opitutae bacterium]MBT6462640.1 ABC transporter ATP-binding protein/permease [Opitutae bacterium]MBT6958298.1 ABC transporter ATP-binding protein/permease [Opitutae bacterium]